MTKRLARRPANGQIEGMKWLSPVLGLLGGVPVALGMIALIYPVQISQSGALGELKAQVAAVDKKLDQLVGKADSTEKAVDTIQQRISAADADPARFLAATGVKADQLWSFVRVGAKGEVFIFPKTDEAKTMLESTGLKASAVAPGIVAYPVPEGLKANFGISTVGQSK